MMQGPHTSALPEEGVVSIGEMMDRLDAQFDAIQDQLARLISRDDAIKQDPSRR